MIWTLRRRVNIDPVARPDMAGRYGAKKVVPTALDFAIAKMRRPDGQLLFTIGLNGNAGYRVTADDNPYAQGEKPGWRDMFGRYWIPDVANGNGQGSPIDLGTSPPSTQGTIAMVQGITSGLRVSALEAAQHGTGFNKEAFSILMVGRTTNLGNNLPMAGSDDDDATTTSGGNNFLFVQGNGQLRTGVGGHPSSNLLLAPETDYASGKILCVGVVASMAAGRALIRMKGTTLGNAALTTVASDSRPLVSVVPNGIKFGRVGLQPEYLRGDIGLALVACDNINLPYYDTYRPVIAAWLKEKVPTINYA